MRRAAPRLLRLLALSLLAACAEAPVPDAGVAPDADGSGGVLADAGPQTDAGLDAGPEAAGDAGPDAGFDGGADAGPDARADAGPDAGADAGADAGPDAGADAGTDGGEPLGGWPGNDDAGVFHQLWGEYYRGFCSSPEEFPRQLTHDAGTQFQCAPGPDAPVGLDTVTRGATQYLRLHAACDTFQFVCKAPCPFDEATLRALYAGFRAVKPELTELMGMDTLPLHLPVTMHLTEDEECRPLPPAAGYAVADYPSGSHVCLFMDRNQALPDGGTRVTPEWAVKRESQVLQLHEYTHTLFFGRHPYSYEFLAYGASYYVAHASADWADACGRTYQYLARPLWELCQRAGFQFADLRPSFLALDEDFRADRGTALKLQCGLRQTNLLQWRARLDPLLGRSTAAAFLAVGAAGYPLLGVGDVRRVGPAGGTLLFAGGRVTLQVPPGALAQEVQVAQSFDSRFFSFPVPDPDGNGWTAFAADNAVVFFPEDLSFAVPVRLTLRHDRSRLPAGGDERRLRLYAGGPNQAFTTHELVPGSTMDADAGVLSADIVHGGLYFSAPLPE